MSKKVDRILHKILWNLLDDISKGDLPTTGICWYVEWRVQSPYTIKIYDRLRELFTKWNYFSGNTSFPITSKDIDFEDPEDAYYYLRPYEGEYGESRVQLIMFILGELSI